MSILENLLQSLDASQQWGDITSDEFEHITLHGMPRCMIFQYDDLKLIDSLSNQVSQFYQTFCIKKGEKVETIKSEEFHHTIIIPESPTDNELNLIAMEIRSIRSEFFTRIDAKIEDIIPAEWASKNPQIELDEQPNSYPFEPILVVRQSDGMLTIIDGHRRFEFAKKMGWTDIPAVIVSIKLEIETSNSELFAHLHHHVPEPDEYDDFNPYECLLQPLSNLLSILKKRTVYDVINHEFNQLVGEFNEGHYTSSGLRTGRLLELLVYGVAIDWEVPIDNPLLSGLERIKTETNNLQNAYLAYYDATNEHQVGAKKKFMEKVLHSQKVLLELLVEDVDRDTEITKKFARNVGAILRSIKKKHSRIEEVRNEFKIHDIEKTVDKIMTIRNDAAHASIDLEKRELTRLDMISMINDLANILEKFSTIGQHIMAYERSRN